MALKKLLTLASGITVENAYIRISEYSGKNKGSTTYKVDAYKDSRAYTEDCSTVCESKIYTIETSITDDSPNILKQGYEGLKLLPEYADAEDC